MHAYVPCFRKLKLLPFLLFFQAIPIWGQSALWVNRFNGAGDNADRYNDMVSDASGNIYLAGYTVRTGTGKDFYTVKTNAAGDTLWTRTFNHTANLDDEADLIALLPDGNIVVCGYSDDGSTAGKTDVLTIAYNPSGAMLWIARYNYAVANEDDLPAAISVDASGNIFIGGRSDHDANNVDDYLILKYNASGVLQWANRYDAGSTDRVADIVAVGGGCVVTGRSNNGANDDLLTISYNNVGTQLWSQTIAGPGGDDRGQSIVADGSGNVYVSGIRSNGDDDDYVTARYNTSGVMMWARLFDSGNTDRASTMCIDASSNIYVTGRSDVDATGNTNYDYYTIKYNSAGLLQWGAYSGNALLQEDNPNAITTDASGNVYVTGKADVGTGGAVNYAWETVKYNSSGVQQWIQLYNGTTFNGEDIPANILIDNAGNTWVTGSIDQTAGQKDAALIKWNAGGTLLSVRTYNGIGDFTDKAHAIATDNAGNTFITGYTMNTGKQKDMILQKINTAGVSVWTKIFDGTGENDEGFAVVTDAVGKIYVAGYTNGLGTFDDVLLQCYSSAGVLQWQQIYNGPAGKLDKIVSMAISPAGDLYLAGYSDNGAGFSTNYDFLILRYNALGLMQWAQTFAGAGGGEDKATEIAVSGSDIYVTGTTFNGSQNDIITLRYDVLGNLVASALYAGLSGGDDIAGGLCISGGSVYVVGSSFVAGNDLDFVTIKYNSALVQQWASLYNGTGDNTDIGNAISVRGTEVYVTGSSKTPSLTDDIALVKYNATTGAKIWAKRFSSTGPQNDVANAIATDNTTNIYLSGSMGSATTVSDYVSLNYNASGKKLLTLKYNGSGNGEDAAHDLTVDSNGYLFVTGNSTGTGNSSTDLTTIKYCTPVPSATVAADGPLTFCNADSVVFSASAGVGYTYQWKKNNANIAGATGQHYTATASGSYKVVVTNANGCSATSKAANVNVIICREEEAIGTFSVFAGPNPFSAATEISWNVLEQDDYQLTITDVMGRICVSKKITDTNTFLLDTPLAAGVYTVRVQGGNEVAVTQIVKQ